MHAKPKIWRAKELADRNRQDALWIKKQFESLQRDAERSDERLKHSLEVKFDGCLVPFAESFSRIKHVDLEDVDLLDRVPKVDGYTPEAFSASFDAVKGMVSVAGGAAAGAGAGALTFTAVGALATASTGTAIGTLSGAAATSATLAWLGGGSLAAGGAGVAGGTLVLASVVAVPVVLAAGGFVSYQGRKELSKQNELEAELEQAESAYKAERKLVRLLSRRVVDTRRTLSRIGAQMGPLNKWLSQLLLSKDDYRRFTPEERDKLALLTALAVLMTAVMREPLLDSEKKINPSHKFTMREARYFV